MHELEALHGSTKPRLKEDGHCLTSRTSKQEEELKEEDGSNRIALKTVSLESLEIEEEGGEVRFSICTKGEGHAERGNGWKGEE